jgi:restriction endonuclease S subunit
MPPFSFSMEVRLEDIAAIRSGYPFRTKIEEVPDGEYGVIQIKDISDVAFTSTENLLRTNLPDVKSDFLLKRGDVLFASRGAKRQATAIDAVLENTVCGSQIFICRLITPQVLPKYLAWFVNQSRAQEYFEAVAGGSYVQIVTKDKLADLRITLPPLEKQHLIVKINELQVRESELLTGLRDKREKLVQAKLLKSLK